MPASPSAQFANIPDDPNRMLSLAVLGDVAATLGDQDAVYRGLRELLLPHAGHQVVLNCYGGGGAHWGPVTRILARGALATGEDDLAATWFDAGRGRSDRRWRPAHGRSRPPRPRRRPLTGPYHTSFAPRSRPVVEPGARALGRVGARSVGCTAQPVAALIGAHPDSGAACG